MRKLSSLIALGLLTTIPLQAQKDGLAGVSLPDSLALSLQKISRQYASKEDYPAAILFMRQAIDILASHRGKPSANTLDLSSDYYFLSEYYDQLGQFSAKMKALDNLLSLCREQGLVNPKYLYALWERTKYLFDIGDFARCTDYAAMGEEDAKKIVDSQHYYNIFLLFHINSQLELKNYQVAEKLLDHKVEESRRVAPEFLWCLYAQLAQVEIHKENYGKALSYYQKSLQACRASGEDIGYLQISEDLGYYIYFKHLGDGRTALSYYRKALLYAKNSKDRTIAEALESLNLLTNIANVYVKFEQYDSAFRYFQLAFDQIGPGMSETGLLHKSLDSVFLYDRIWYLTALMIDKGDACFRQYRTNRSSPAIREAIRIYKAADKVLDRIKSEQAEITSRLFWRSDSRRLYEHAIEASYLEGNIPDAFYFFEKSRSVLLNDQLNKQRFLGNNDILQQAQLKKKILSLKRELDDPGALPGRNAGIIAGLFLYQRRLDSLEQGIKAVSDKNFISLQDVQKNLLQDHQALLELFAGDSSVYSLLVTSDHASLTRVDKARFDSIARLFISYISDPVSANKDITGYHATAFQLYQLIFQNNSLPAGRIIISPDGRYFPFEALITGNASSPSPTWFLQDHAVSYTYSARYLLNNTVTDTGDVAGSFMGVAPVQYASYLDLPALRGSERSLERIGSYFGNPEKFLSIRASRNNFLKQFSKYRILQLYTHASDSSMVSGEPVIYFADSALYLSDLIPEERPVTRLIVLSACETGNGKIYQGEGVFSFNREFAALGIPSSVINLWAVDNESTYQVTELFYKYLAKGMPVDRALQKAKIEFLQTASKEKSLPYYWAASVLAGRTDPIAYQKSYPWKSLVWITCLAGLAILGFRYSTTHFW